MATPQTRHQKKIIDRYYQHKDTIQSTKLMETLSELYLADTDAKATKLWKRCATALKQLGVSPTHIDTITESRDVEKLAKLIKQADAGTAPGQQSS
ncbi:MAG: hypothetical protein AAF750_17445 [Planctomycetota bacterium]